VPYLPIAEARGFTALSVNKTVVEWLTNHINKEDKDLGLYLRKE